MKSIIESPHESATTRATRRKSLFWLALGLVAVFLAFSLVQRISVESDAPAQNSENELNVGVLADRTVHDPADILYFQTKDQAEEEVRFTIKPAYELLVITELARTSDSCYSQVIPNTLNRATVSLDVVKAKQYRGVYWTIDINKRLQFLSENEDVYVFCHVRPHKQFETFSSTLSGIYNFRFGPDDVSAPAREAFLPIFIHFDAPLAKISILSSTDPHYEFSGILGLDRRLTIRSDWVTLDNQRDVILIEIATLAGAATAFFIEASRSIGYWLKSLRIDLGQ